jgi:hypothetical protein
MGAENDGQLIEDGSHYVAHTSIQSLALLDETKGSKNGRTE